MKEYKEDDYLQLSGIQHYAFCRRQWALIHIEQQWCENYRTTAGEIFHERAHDESITEKRNGILTVRGLKICSRELGISGQCDIVEFHMDSHGIHIRDQEGKWCVIPIEYKRGEPKDDNSDILQLCLQAMCLEEMFLTSIPYGYLFYGKNKRRMKVDFDEKIRSQVQNMIVEMHELYARGYTPNCKKKPRCKACSLTDICLPNLQTQTSVDSYISHELKGCD